MSKPCPQCHGDVGKRLTVVETIGGYTFGCPHRVHALAQEVVEAAAAWWEFADANLDNQRKRKAVLRAAVARLREEMEKP